MSPKYKTPKRKWDHKWQHKSGNANKKPRRGQQKSDSRVSRTIRWKIRKVVEFKGLRNKNKTKWLERNRITRGQISRWTSKVKSEWQFLTHRELDKMKNCPKGKVMYHEQEKKLHALYKTRKSQGMKITYLTVII